MKVLMLTNAIVPDKLGGLERYVRELSTQLARRGVQVVILTKRQSPALPLRETDAHGVRIIRYPVPPKSSPLFAPRRGIGPVAQVLRTVAEHPDAVLHAHFPVPAVPLAVRHRYLYTFHAPVYREILHERQGSYVLPTVAHRPAVGAMQLAERVAVSRADRVVVLSEFTRGELAALSPRAAESALRIPGGVDLSQFGAGPGIAGDPWVAAADPLLMAARRLTPRTGVRELIQAMPRIRAELPNARLAIAGAGGMDSALREEAAGVAGDAIRFLGRVGDPDLANWYRTADLVVMPTQDLEGFGLTTAEALACGTPVVGTPIGANPELLAELDAGLVTDGIDAESIAAGVLRALAGPVRRLSPERLSSYAARYGWDAVCDAYLAEYERHAIPAVVGREPALV